MTADRAATAETPRPEPLPAAPPSTQFPLHISPNRRRLLDPAGRPVLLQGDAAWSLIANTTL